MPVAEFLHSQWAGLLYNIRAGWIIYWNRAEITWAGKKTQRPGTLLPFAWTRREAVSQETTMDHFLVARGGLVAGIIGTMMYFIDRL